MIIEIADCETDGLLDTMTRLWTLQIGSADGADVDLYCDVLPGYKPISEGIARLQRADRVVFHNGLGFDLWAINTLYPDTLRPEQIFDTLIAARLLDPEERNHSLEDWGERLGIPKGTPPDDWTTWDDSKMDYARQDIMVTRPLYHRQIAKLDGWGRALDIEHKVAWAIAQQEQNGFLLDVPAAQALELELRESLQQIERNLQAVFPPIDVPIDKVPFVPKRDDKKRGYQKGAPIVRMTTQIFNPASRQQAAERLKSLGWKPKDFTDSGLPKIDADVLAPLPYPEARALLRYFTALKKLGQLADGENGWLKLVRPTGRIHGRVNPLGAATGRMSHFRPNVAQVDKDRRMRSLWKSRPGWKLVGCDAEGLEARMLAHYLAAYDKGAFTDRLLNGKKEDATDIHSANAAALKPIGDCGRDGAKTILYALMYGASDMKLGATLKDGCRTADTPVPKAGDRIVGKKVRAAIARTMIGIDRLTAAIEARVKQRGYLVALDGRRLPVRKSHAALNTLLQGGGAIVMKLALALWMTEVAPTRGWIHGVDYALCANVHDEVQIECRPDIAEDVGRSFAESITEAGRRLNVRCPLAGSYDIGTTWAETH